MKITRQWGWYACVFKNLVSMTLAACVCSVSLNWGGTPLNCSADAAADDAAQSKGGMGSYLPVVAYCTQPDVTSEGGGEPHVHNLPRQPEQPSAQVYRVYSRLPLPVCALASLHTAADANTHTHGTASSPETSSQGLPDSMCHMASHPHPHHFKDQRDSSRGNNETSDTRWAWTQCLKYSHSTRQFYFL